jgi:hypothetical protein
MNGWVYIIGGGVLIVVGGICASYGWHILPKPAEQKEATIIPAVQQEQRIPLVDLELVRVGPSPEFPQAQIQFAYDIFIKNKSSVAISNIRVMRAIDPGKNRQKIAVHGATQGKLSTFQKQVNVLAAGESKKIHRERSASYEYMTLTVTYQDDVGKPYKCLFEGDRDGLNLKLKSSIGVAKPKP